ncbi:hypothetical protein FRC17_009188 [Serendipita sp. 399]|nr:hypothetical protein FRC17_009188 [Serendipita sp. 399]
MKHLRDHAIQLQIENPDAIVFAAFITFAPEGFSVIPLEHLEIVCLERNGNESCTKPSVALDNALSSHFRLWDEQQRNRKEGYYFLSEMVEHALKQLPRAQPSQQPVLS